MSTSLDQPVHEPMSFDPYLAGYDRMSDADVPGRERMLILFKNVSVAFQRMCTQWRRATGISPTDHTALNALWSAGPSTMGELAANVGISKAAATALVTRLEALGLVSRTSDTADRRRVIIELLPTWSQQLSPLIADFDVDMQRIANEFDDREWERAVNLFDDLADVCIKHADVIKNADTIEIDALANQLRRGVTVS